MGPLKWKRIYIIIIAVLLFVSTAPYISVFSAGREEIPQKNILILNSYHKGYAWTDDQMNAISETLKGSEVRTILYTEYMDWKRHPVERTIKYFYDTIKDKYSDIPIDMIVVTDDAALEFVIEYREELLNNAPIIFSGVNEIGIEEIIDDRHDMTGVVEMIDPIDTIKMALEVDPSIKKVYVVFDNSDSGLSSGKLLMEKLHLIDDQITAIPLNNLTADELLAKVTGLTSDSVVLVTTYYSDAVGKTVEFDQFYRELSEKSRVPMYSIYDYTLNQGAIGGSMISGYLQGKIAAEMAVRVLQGEDPNEMPFVTTNITRDVFDYEQLQRFNISLDRLPEGSEVINQPFSFYETYKILVICTISVIIILISLIAILIFYVEQVKKVRKKLAQTNERFDLATNGSEAVIWDLDMTTNEHYFSDSWYDILGYEMGEVNEFHGGWRTILHPEDIQAEARQRQEHIEGKSKYYYCEYRLLSKSGEYKWFQTRGTMMRGLDGYNSRFAGSMTDVTDRKGVDLELQRSYEELETTYEELTALQEELTEQYNRLIESQEILTKNEERYRLITEATNDGIWDVNYQTDEYFYSQRWYELLMIDDGELDGNFMKNDRIHPDDLEIYMDSVEEHTVGKSDFYQCEVRLALANGTYRWFLLRGKVLFDGSGQVYRMAGSISDIELLKESQRRLHGLAYNDVLTELPNRLSLSVVFRTFIEHSKDSKAALFFLDIDNFKFINDSMGHTYGDQLLKKVGIRLKGLSDGHQVCFRFGGDEFVIFLTNIRTDDEVIQYAETLMHAFKEPFQLSESNVHISTSIGIAQYPENGLDIEELLKNADLAMYKAKETRKGNFVIYDQFMQDSLDERIAIEKHLREAITNQEFCLYYQPQVSLNTGEVEGFEALIRWNSPVLGFVSPLSFIEIAEECRLIIPIGEWVLRTSCYFIKDLHRQGYEGYHVSVNISVVQLMQEDFTDMVLKVLEEVNLSPECLELEITESIIMESFEESSAKLEFLRSKGVAIALDDFGTGYSSLSYLKQLPITTLKIDKSFMDGVLGHPSDASITSCMIAIGHEMGLKIVAEGIEIEEQLTLLKQMNCDKVQGYFISRPIPAQDVVKWLESRV
ncbi:ABC transporter substrate binding protein [Paenibacillus sp. FA6]|uniref:ABC transporter substrate binding protein n=1 Tax=Paenibacillus sp. FA6 TaxID=3413029 RepID=UPI003F65B9E3